MPPALNRLSLADPALIARLRDIHPGPDLPIAPDPRLPGWGWLLLALSLGLLLATVLRAGWCYRYWATRIDWEAADLVPRLQAVLRETALARWPEARALQGAQWLAFLDAKGGSQFGEFAGQWPHWLYSQASPDRRQKARLRRAYLRWGCRCLCLPSLRLCLSGPRGRGSQT